MENSRFRKFLLNSGRKFRNVRKEEKSAIQGALRKIGRRDHSIAEIERYLQKKYDEDICKTAVEYLKKHDLLNDERFAEMVIRSYRSRGKGVRYIEQKLYQKEVEKSIYKKMLHGSDEEEFAYDALEKKFLQEWERAKEENISEEKIKLQQKMYRFLSSRGFLPNITSSAIQRLIGE